MFDFKELVKRLNDKGVPVLEDAAELVVGETLDWVSESAMQSDNAIVKGLGALVPVVKPMIMSGLDNIDGKVGQ